MARATGIDHIAIYFSDMQAAKKFFIDGFGLTLKEEYNDEMFLQVGSQLLAIFKGNNKKQTINHLALKVDNFNEVKSRLEKLGHKLYDNNLVDGPDGITIQLVR